MSMPEVVTVVDRIRWLFRLVIIILVGEMVFVGFHLGTSVRQFRLSTQKQEALQKQSDDVWRPPDASAIPAGVGGELIRYGRELIEHTAVYLGPKGKVLPISNGLSCQNCHLQGGTKLFAANFSAVASTYPKFRKRSGTTEGFEKRVNGCLERSLNGKKLPNDSREMKAMVAYLKWVGTDVQRGKRLKGAGLVKLPLLHRPADPVKGRENYLKYCSRCHGENGKGVKAENEIEWKYPPLWGRHSYNTGAGLYRLSKFAAFIKANMPYGVSYENPVLSDEVAWDIAAYVNSMPRPHKDFPHDWPNLAEKPVDHPFGPYADHFSEKAHKYGPFDPILAAKQK